MSRRLACISGLFGLTAIGVRIPFAARRLWDHDSIQFALGVERFDLAAHQPHPPGYPLYIGLLKLLHAVGVEPGAAMVALAALSGGLGAALMVPLAARLSAQALTGSVSVSTTPSWDTGIPVRAAALAATLYAFNPLLWFYGELPLIYAVEGGMSVALAWAAVSMVRSRSAFYWTCILYALIGGLRPSTMILLGPLVVWGGLSGWRRGTVGTRDVLAGSLVTAMAISAWALPLLAVSGGPAVYRQINSQHFTFLLRQTSILYGAGPAAMAHNLEVLTKWALQGMFPGVVVVGLLWLSAPRAFLPGLQMLFRQAGFLLLWGLPAVTFFAFFHITKAGYTLIHLPALLLVIVLAAGPALAAGRTRYWTAVGVGVLLGGAIFLFGEQRHRDEPRFFAVARHEFNRYSIESFEQELDQVRSLIERRFEPQRTVLLSVELSGGGGAAAVGFLYPFHRHLQWYFPSYRVALLVPEAAFALVTQGHAPFTRVGQELPLPETVEWLVFILSAPTDDRFPLAGGEELFAGKNFLVVTLPRWQEQTLQPFRLLAEIPSAG